MVTVEKCYQCGIDFIAHPEYQMVDTWICPNCIRELVNEEIITDSVMSHP